MTTSCTRLQPDSYDVVNKEFVMQLGMIGLGRMGANMVRRLCAIGHTCVVYDRNPGAVTELAAEGAQGAASLDELVEKLE